MPRHGAEDNPPNRFERIAYAPDPDLDPADAPAPSVQLYADPTRKILATNDSPDVGFDVSVNPYRGCTHGCVYCLGPETPVLHADMIWRPIGEVQAGDVLVGFDENAGPEGKRELRPAVVQNVWRSRKSTSTLVTERAHVTTTADHRWLRADGVWSRTDQLSAGWEISAAPDREGPCRVATVQPGPVRDVIDIQTSTGTFYAAGLATHNCYARPTHEYLGFSAGLDFETRIMVKRDAPALLRKALTAPGWKPQTIALSGVTDPYQPAERELRLTRGCLEVLAELRNPVVIVTKNRLVARDADLLAELARHDAVSVLLSVTTLDPALHRVMEPGSSAPRLRLAALEALAAAGVPAGVLVAPVIPGLTDHEIPAILEAAAGAGARFAGHVVLRLPHGVKQLFESWLERHFPERKQKVMNRILSLRGGRLNDPRFGSRMRGEGPWAEQIHALFELGVRRAGLGSGWPKLSAAAFRRPGPAQTTLF